MSERPRIAVVAGPTATILSTEPLVTSNQARLRHGLPPRIGVDGRTPEPDVLRPQRLAAPVRVYIEQFSAHPLERDAHDLYGPPDGYIDANHEFHRERSSPSDVPVYEAELRPEHGLHMLPYMARRADGSAWDGDSAGAAGDETSRQPFFPDASRLFEEIDRFGVGADGWGSRLARLADFDFFRAAPSGGYRSEGERRGKDFFPYRPTSLRAEPTRAALAAITNRIQEVADSSDYAGFIWLEGSPNLEETLYWLSLLIDTRVPIVGCAAQRTHGSLGAEGDRNIVDAVTYIVSGVWRGADGGDCVGPVAIQDQLIFSARELVKVNSRPGGYRAAGAGGGVLGVIDHRMVPRVEFQPRRRFTHDSEVNFKRVADARVLDAQRRLNPETMPVVSIVKMGRYQDDQRGMTWQRDVEARMDDMLSRSRLAGIVAEGAAAYGTMSQAADEALRSCVFRGVPVMRAGRGTPEGISRPDEGGLFLAGTNLGATKARLLLTACLLRFGGLPAAEDPQHPSDAEVGAIREKLAEFQSVLDTH